MSRLSGFFIIFISVLTALFFSGGLITFVDVPSIITVVGVTFGGIFAGYGSEGWRLLKVAFTEAKVDSQESYYQVVYFFQYVITLVLGAASMAVIMSVVHLLSNMDDPKQVGPALAFSLLSVFYAVGFILLFVLPNKHHFIQVNRFQLDLFQQQTIQHESKLSQRVLAITGVTSTLTLISLLFVFQFMVDI
jgi:flagellar motor component MotA